MKIGLAISGFIFLSAGALYAQEDPQDDVGNLLKQMPPIFTQVCSASHSEMDAYAKRLKAFNDLVSAKLDSLRALEAKAQAQAKPNLLADVSSQQREFERLYKNLSQKSYTGEMQHALHGDAETVYKAKSDTIFKIMKQHANSGNVKGLEADQEELHQARVAYCEAVSGIYVNYLQRERALLENEAAYQVAFDDAAQRINCIKMGTIYHRELSRKQAYTRIIWHAQNMYLLLVLNP